MNIFRNLPQDSFLRRHFVQEMHASCPSTTACALTSIATAQYPNRHGIAGWFTHIPSLGHTVATLPFTDRRTGESLASRGIGVDKVLLLPPIAPRLTHRPLTIVPAIIANTIYNTYSRGGTDGAGYHSIAHGMDRIAAYVGGSPEPTYTHLYLPEIDALCHRRGVGHPHVLDLAVQIDHQLARLADLLRGRARIVVGADHGLIDVPKPDQTLLMSDDPMLQMLHVPPSGDARLPIFHLRPSRHDEFVASFHARFGDRMLLVPTDEVERLELFGAGPCSVAARPRFGDYVGVPFRPATLSYHSPTKPLGELYVAVHAGLSPEEMLTPLVIA